LPIDHHHLSHHASQQPALQQRTHSKPARPPKNDQTRRDHADQRDQSPYSRYFLSLPLCSTYSSPPTDQVQAIYGPNHPTSTFAVITSRFDSGGRIREIEYTAQAIVYTREKSLAEWKLLVEGETGSTTVQAVEGLYRKLQGMLDKVTSKFPSCDS